MNTAPKFLQQVQAIRQLRILILSGEIPVGQRVSELAMAEKLNISRTPVRLALSILEHEGLLKSRLRGGFVVRQFTIKDIHHAIEIRGMLEGMAARRAAERSISDEEMTPIREVTAKLNHIIGIDDYAFLAKQYMELNAHFHTALLKLADSAMLDRSFAHVVSLPFASPIAFAFSEDDSAEHIEHLKNGQNQHTALLEAIENGQGMRAETITREHAFLALKVLSRALKDKDLRQRIPGVSLLNLSE